MKDYLFKEQSPYPSILLGHTKPEGGYPTKHEDTVIVPIIKHSGYLGRAVWITPSNTCLAIQLIKLHEISVLSL